MIIYDDPDVNRYVLTDVDRALGVRARLLQWENAGYTGYEEDLPYHLSRWLQARRTEFYLSRRAFLLARFAAVASYEEIEIVTYSHYLSTFQH